MKTEFIINWRRGSCMLLLLLAVLAGCSGKGASSEMIRTQSTAAAPQAAPAPAMDMAAAEEMGYYGEAEYSAVAETQAAAGGVVPEGAQQKIILEASLSMATDRFDEVSQQLRDTAAVHGGYVESSSMSVRHDNARVSSITIRVPSEQYEAALSRIKGLCALTEANENQRNATAEYYDIKARLDTKLIEEERLLELVSKAQKVEDILELERLLGEVRTQIEVYNTQMTSIDRLSAYSTIAVSLIEVMDETAVVVPQNLGGRMRESFVKSINATVRFMQNILILVIGLSVPAFVIAVALLVIWVLFRIRRAVRMRNRKE